MSEGMMMLLVILFVFFVVLPLFVRSQVRRENQWKEEDMIDFGEDEEVEEEDNDSRYF